MDVISIWQPYASLAIHGHKTIETRGWPIPKRLIRQRIGIAATKTIHPEQRRLFADPEFQKYYRETGLPDTLEELPRGCVLGTALVHSCDPIDQETIEDITEAEFMFGDYGPGRYAWRLRAQQAFGPFYARGQQGLWKWSEPNDVATGNQDNHQKGAPTLRRQVSARLR